MHVRSAVLPAAGLGTRFLPASKAVAKELMPLGDTPAVQFVIDEAVGAGIEHIVIVSSREKPAVERYFEPMPELEAMMEAKGRPDVAARLRSIGRDWRVTVVYQDQPLGLGHAVGCARDAVGDEAFAVMLPDEIMGASTLLAQMIEVCTRSGGSVVGLKRVPHEDVVAYGVIDPAGPVGADGVVAVRDLVEKPSVDEAPSDLILIGRYVLTSDVFDEIERLEPGRGGELQLTDALRAQATRAPFHGVVSTIERYDTGTPVGLLTAAIELTLRSPELGPELAEYLRQR